MECGQAYEQSDNKPKNFLSDKHLEVLLKERPAEGLLVAF